MNSRRKIKPATMHTEEQAEGIELEIGRKLEARWPYGGLDGLRLHGTILWEHFHVD
jgi:hypothetical protein